MKRAVIGALLLAGCEADPDILDAFFVDDVVGAPARKADLLVLEGPGCDDVLSVPIDEVASTGAVLLDRSTGFPIHPDEQVLDGLKRDSPLTFHVVAKDEEDVILGRGCAVITLDSSVGTLNVPVQVDALPVCSEVPFSTLDITIVLDTAIMGLHFPGNEHLDTLKENFVRTRSNDTSFSIVTHGHTIPPVELLAPTTDQQTVVDTLDTLRDEAGGEVALFEAVALAARLQRARATCIRRPVILVLEGGADPVETNIPVQEAQIGLYATVGYELDDIYMFGIFSSIEAQGDLLELAAELLETRSDVVAGASESQLLRAFFDAKIAFDALIQ